MKKEKVFGLLTIALVMTMSMVFGSLQAEAYTFKVTGSGKNTTKTVYVTKGEKTSLKLQYRASKNKKYTTKNVTWKVVSGSSKARLLNSKNSTVLKTRKKAKTVYVKARNKGTAKIQTTYKGKTYKANIVVESGLKMNQSKVSLDKGKTTTLKIKNTNRTPAWSSENVKVATVNKNGKVTAVGEGTTKIYGKVGSKKYSCTVTVKEKKTDSNTNSDFPYTVKWSMVEERLKDSSNSPWSAYDNEKTTVIRGCTKKLSVSGLLTEAEVNQLNNMDDLSANEIEKVEEEILGKLKKNLAQITITSSNTSVATVEKIKYDDNSSTCPDGLMEHGIIATVNIKGVGTTTITLKTPTQELKFQITGLKSALDLRDEQIAEFKKNYITSGMSDYDKICKLREYVIANYKEQTYFGNQNPSGHEGEEYYMYNSASGNQLIYYTKEGSCVIFAGLVCDFCHELGITSYVYYDEQQNHEWNYLLLDGKYYKVDMSTSPIIAKPELINSLPNGAILATSWKENN